MLSSNLVTFSLDADRAPQLKAVVLRLPGGWGWDGRFMKRLIVCALVSVLVAQSSLFARAQSGSWRAYWPRDNSFSVELPAPLRRVESFSGEHNASLERSQRTKWATCYAAIETTPEDSRFGVIVINAKHKQFRSKPRDGERGLFWYLGALLIGNEDEATPSKVQVVDVNGLRGKEYIYTQGGVTTRGRIFEDGNKIFVIVFVGEKAEDLTFADAERFLNSFRVRKSR